MIRLNKPPIDIRIKIDWRPTITVTHAGTPPACGVNGAVNVLYGNDYVANVCGFRVIFAARDTPTDDTRVQIETPGSDYDSGWASGINNQEVWVYIDGYQLVVDEACENWDFSADLVGFYGDEARTDVLLELASFADSGTLFDRRFTATRWTATGDPDDWPYASTNQSSCVTCDMTLRSEFYQCFIESRNTGDTTWVRQNGAMDEEALPTPLSEPCGTCSSEIAELSINADKSFSGAGEHLFVNTADAIAYTTIDCPNDPPGPSTQQYSYINHPWHWTRRELDFNPASRTGGLPDRDKHAEVATDCCDGSGSLATSDSSATGSITYWQTTRNVAHAEGDRWCNVTAIPPLCASGDFPIPVPSQDTCCYYSAEKRTTWGPAGCTDTVITCVSSDVNFDGVRVTAFIVDGVVQIEHSDRAGNSVDLFDTGIAASWVYVKYDQRDTNAGYLLLTQEP